MNDLQLRFLDFAAKVMVVTRDFRKEIFLEDGLRQVVRSASSIGANYSEAQSANSLKDFHNKIRIALKETKETNFWLRYLIKLYPEKPGLTNLNKECLEIMKILGTISKKTDPNLHSKKP